MKLAIITVFLFICKFTFGQNLTTIKVTVPNISDEVYIVGNQKNLGNWEPSKVKLAKISEYEREISLALVFPAEFKFTRGNWESEAIITSLYNQPNIILDTTSAKNNSYRIQGWTDAIDKYSTFSEFQIKHITSKILNQDRKIYVALPENYSQDLKYPVVYITDAQNLNNFEMALQTLRQQANYNSIPKCILVGIYQYNRGDEIRFEKASAKKFKDFIFDELIPYIDSTYSTTNYRAMVGHSDAAEYNHYLMFRDDNPFNAFVNISEDVKKLYPFMDNKPFAEAISQYQNYFSTYKGKVIKLFTASGEYDFWHRYEAGAIIDSLYRSSPNKDIKFEHKVYPAEHNELVAYAMQEGLKFVFSEYRDFRKFKADLIQFSDYKAAMDSVKSGIQRYGIAYDFSAEDKDIMNDIVWATKDYDLFKHWNVEENKNYSFYNKLQIATILMDINPSEANTLFDEAITEKNKDIIQFLPYFVYNDSRVNNPKTTISKLQRLKSFNPNSLLEINYFIAKTAKETNVETKIGTKSLEYCERNFRTNRYFAMANLQALKIKQD